MTKAFPYHDDCYTWPRVAVVHDAFGATALNVALPARHQAPKQSVKCQQSAALAGRRLDNHVTDDKDGEDGVVAIDWAVYSNGQPVFAIVDWLDGYATLVHHPDDLKPDSDSGELKEELCPCCEGMPQGAGDGGKDDAPTTDS